MTQEKPVGKSLKRKSLTTSTRACLSLRMKLLRLPSLFQAIPLQYRCKGEDSNIIIHQNGSTSLLKLLCETEKIQRHCFKVHVSSTFWVVCGCHTSQKDSALLWHDLEHKTWPLFQQGIRAGGRDPRIYNNKPLLLPGLIVSACERAGNWDSSLWHTAQTRDGVICLLPSSINRHFKMG